MPKPNTRMSMRDFARMAKVSASTVSRVFAEPDIVSPATRERVLKLAQRCGFRPSPVTRASVGSATRSVGVLLPGLSVNYFADIAMGIQNKLLGADYLPVLLAQCPLFKLDLRGIQRLVDHRVDALIFGGGDEGLQQKDIVAVTGDNLPLITIDQPHPDFTNDTVLNDDESGGYQVGQHLASLGHKRVAAIHYGQGTSTSDARINGCRAALTTAGGRIDKADIIQVPTNISQAGGTPKPTVEEQLECLFSTPDRPTAIFTSNDLQAKAVYSVARKLNLKIPDELSVVGFADLTFTELMDPPLTTVRQNGFEMGCQAAELALNRLAEPTREFRRIVIPTRLIVRQSTAKPKDR